MIAFKPEHKNVLRIFISTIYIINHCIGNNTLPSKFKGCDRYFWAYINI